MTKHCTGRRWLLAIDGSPSANQAAEYVARWAHAFDLEDVCVLYAQQSRSPDADRQSAYATTVALRALDDAGIAYRARTDIGDPTEVIIAAAQSERATELLIGSGGMTMFAHLMLGSVAYKVIHLADLPITVFPYPQHAADHTAAESEDAHRLLIAVDGSTHAMRAVHYACDLAGTVSLEVTLLNVPLPILSGNVRRFVSHEMIESYYQEEGRAALEPAETALASSGIRADRRIIAGHAGPTIVETANQCGCTRIVMGTRGAGAVGNVILGSVAYQVLYQARLPVTLVK